MLEKLKAQKSMNSVRRILRSNGIPFREEGTLLLFTYEGTRYICQRRVYLHETKMFVRES